MIISHEHRFIYIRCRKTASTSIELALSRVCGPDDVITPIQDAGHEALRRSIGGRGPQHYSNPDGTARFYGHMPAAEVRLLVGEEIWTNYFTWCVERNPWDKVISRYYARHRDRATRPPLLTFLESGSAHYVVNFRLYTVGSRVVTDHIARFEHLGLELDRIGDRLGLPRDALELPRANSEHRTDRRHHSALYSAIERDFVAELFAPEIALLGYRFTDGLEPGPAGGS
ncbi:hypothetical protein [Actinomadura sp. NPDC048394]|uniref:hypothetical protein n=1 Tax=Actinomadura sp. NPDC048394 TaxID=3158223 RepID=UPI0033EC27D5